jgi:hypothetical protein
LIQSGEGWKQLIKINQRNRSRGNRNWFFCNLEINGVFKINFRTISNFKYGKKHSPINRRHTRHVVLRTNSFSEQSISDLPCEHCWVFSLVICDSVYNGRRSDLRFWTANYASFKTSSFVISVWIWAGKFELELIH